MGLFLCMDLGGSQGRCHDLDPCGFDEVNAQSQELVQVLGNYRCPVTAQKERVVILENLGYLLSQRLRVNKKRGVIDWSSSTEGSAAVGYNLYPLADHADSDELLRVEMEDAMHIGPGPVNRSVHWSFPVAVSEPFDLFSILIKDYKITHGDLSRRHFRRAQNPPVLEA